MDHKSIAFLFPGQGAQYVGMGKDFYDRFPEAKEIFLQGDDVLGSSFSRLIFEGPREELTLTKNSQPAIYIVSLALCKVLRTMYPNIVPGICAGLSLGEYTALAASGKISFEEGLTVVAKRAAFMQQACEERSGSMRVVLGLEEEKVRSLLLEAGASLEAWVANVNCPGQIVIAGTCEGLDAAAEVLKQGGAKRVLPLEVSGAFHSDLMKSAQNLLTPYLMQMDVKETPVRLVMNTPGDFVEDASLIRKNLIRQVTQPVLWQKGIEAMVKNGVDCFIEIGCGKTLQGMNKRIGVTVPTMSLEKTEELQNFQ